MQHAKRKMQKEGRRPLLHSAFCILHSGSARYRLALYLMLAPYLVGTLVLVALPLALAIGLAFTDYDGLAPPAWVGLANMRFLLHDDLARIAAWNTTVFVATAVPLRVLLALGLALLLNRRGAGLYRAAVYLPTVVPTAAYALAWLWIFNPLYGPLNLLLAGAGLPAPAWLADRATALPALVIAALFQMGESFVVLLAGLQAIPQDYYHAAALDGAGRWQRLRRITLPLLAPWLALVLMREIIVGAQSTFAPALLMTGGGPYYATLFLPQLMYETAFDRFRFGQGAALMLLTLLATGAVLLLLHRLSGGWGYQEEA